MEGPGHWPFFSLRVTTPQLELRYPDDATVYALVDLAASGIHDPASMPFGVPWTDAPDGELQRSSLQHYWRMRADLTAASWNLGFAVFVDGELVGVQDVGAKDFGRLRTVLTGSWLGRAAQGRGIGKEMRRAVLHLAFAGLRAEVAETSAWHDNSPSLGVTRTLGYSSNGETLDLRRDVADRMLKFRMPRSHWEAELRADDVEIHGLEDCLPLLGA